MTPSHPTPSLLLQMIEQNDQKHEAGHRRLRVDLTEGVNALNNELALLEHHQRDDHDLIMKLYGSRERRKELSMNKAVVIAATIGASSNLIVALIRELFQWLGQLGG